MINVMELQCVEIPRLCEGQTTTKLEIQNSWRSNGAGVKNALHDIRIVMSS